MSERIEIAVAESKQIDIWDKIAEYFKDKKILENPSPMT